MPPGLYASLVSCRHRIKQKEKQEEIKRQRLERKRQLLESKDSSLQRLKQDERFNNLNQDRFHRKKRTKTTIGELHAGKNDFIKSKAQKSNTKQGKSKK